MNRTQISIWHLGPEDIAPPAESSFTETTDAQALVALLGQNTLFMMEKISRLDLAAPGMKTPFLLQGPVLDIPCQVVRLGEADGDAGLLIAFSRGYGQAMAEVLLNICRRDGLRPGGEGMFMKWLEAWKA